MLTQLLSYEPPKWASSLKDIPQFFVQVSNFDITCLSFALTSPNFTLSTTRKIGLKSNLKVRVLDTYEVKQKISLVFFVFC